MSGTACAVPGASLVLTTSGTGSLDHVKPFSAPAMASLVGRVAVSVATCESDPEPAQSFAVASGRFLVRTSLNSYVADLSGTCERSGETADSTVSRVAEI